ncbi:hypothetical protein Harreka1_38 [Olleya phage Harreka_1]|uniref:Uncharacterized protein n=1 Tax=Olleya phage Harreka_1 TaxID=2745673 RepID=A0A8E5E8S1_9CAUD|nr:hypothetical protein M1M26_gp38 [Olleya phage Harreka_1]QQV90445.1 hypothetical protein Harreka1_38 [Olleya phage Harreka_1]
MKVKCIDNSGVEDCFVEGKKYKALGENKKKYKLKDEELDVYYWDKQRFEIVKPKKMKNKKKIKALLKDIYNSNDTHPRFKAEIKEIYPELEVKQELEIGKWYRRRGLGTSYLLNYQGDEILSYGFWNGNYDSWDFHKNGLGKESVLATEEEVKTALIKEAKRLGVWNTPIKCLYNEANWGLDDSFTVCYNLNMNGLWSHYGQVFKNGVFAEPLETITKEDAEKQLGKIIAC